MRMKLLRLNHGKEVTVENSSDVKKVVKIFREREPFYYQNKDKAPKEALNNWNHLCKIFPKDTMAATPLDFFFVPDPDNPDNLKVNMEK
jgi:hypothetical protein